MEVKLNGAVDYILTGERCWITVKKFSICIHTTDEGVVVDIYPLGKENEDAIASTYAFDAEIIDFKMKKPKLKKPKLNPGLK